VTLNPALAPAAEKSLNKYSKAFFSSQQEETEESIERRLKKKCEPLNISTTKDEAAAAKESNC
jgi:hypothetical protein